jgi:hypothetical protein
VNKEHGLGTVIFRVQHNDNHKLSHSREGGNPSPDH